MKKRKLALVLLSISLLMTGCSSNSSTYKKAQGLLQDGKYEEAIEKFEKINNYEDSGKYIQYCKALMAAENGEYGDAVSTFAQLGDFVEADFLEKYYDACLKVQNGSYEDLCAAKILFEEIPLFSDSKDKAAEIDGLIEALYQEGISKLENGEFEVAYGILDSMPDYSDAQELAKASRYERGKRAVDLGDYDGGIALLTDCGDYKDSEEQILLTQWIKAYSDFVKESGNFPGYDPNIDGVSDNPLSRYEDQEIDPILFEVNEIVSKDLALDLCERAKARYAENDFENGNNLFAPIFKLDEIVAEKWPQEDIDILMDVYHFGDYQRGNLAFENKDYETALNYYRYLGDYKDSIELIKECKYQSALEYLAAEDYHAAYIRLKSVGDYKDASEVLHNSKDERGITEVEEYLLNNRFVLDEDGTAITLSFDEEELCALEADVKKNHATIYWSWYVDAVDSENGDVIAIQYKNMEDGVNEKEDMLKDIDQIVLSRKDETITMNTDVLTAQSKRYTEAVALKEEGKYEEAIAVFKLVKGYSDSADQITACETAILDEAYAAAVALKDDGKYDEAIEAFTALEGYSDSTDQITACETAILDEAYAVAVALKDEGKYDEAIAAFTALEGYSDSTDQITACETAILDEAYAEAETLKNEGRYGEAIKSFKELEDYKDSKDQIDCIYYAMGEEAEANQLFMKASAYYAKSGALTKAYACRYNYTVYDRIAQSGHNYVLINSNNSITSTGNSYTIKHASTNTENTYSYDFSNWNNMVAVSANSYYIAGLTADGHVLVEGNAEADMDTTSWEKIVSIVCLTGGVVGLKSDGTVVACGSAYIHSNKCDYSDLVNGWDNIVALIRIEDHGVAGLKKDGTIVESTKYDWINTDGWTDVIALTGSTDAFAGLKEDGGLYCNGSCSDIVNAIRQSSEWNDIEYLSANFCTAVGMKYDGTYVYTGNWDSKYKMDNFNGDLPQIDTWTNVKPIINFNLSAIGVQENGILTGVGHSEDLKCVGFELCAPMKENYEDILLF